MKIRWVFLLGSAVFTSACATAPHEVPVNEVDTSGLYNDGLSEDLRRSQEDGVLGKPLTEEELTGVLLGNTMPLHDGSVYFHSDNIATIYRDGGSEQVEWEAEGSRFCHGADLLGGDLECIEFSQDGNGDYLQSYEGTTRVISQDEIFTGDVLSQ